MKTSEKVLYIFKKVNWGQSHLDAEAIGYMNEILNEIEKLEKSSLCENCQPKEIDVTRCPNCNSTDHKIDKPYKCYDCGTVW